MENSMNEGEVHEAFRSPPRRRRSTFFERRDSIAPLAVPETTDVDLFQKPVLNQDHEKDLTTYYSKLLIEKEQWKKEVNHRRNKYHDLRQQYQMVVKASGRSRISYSALSSEDIEFLKAKPNLSKLVESQLKLHKSVKETRALYRRANELDDVILNICEENVNKITNYILENSTVEASV